MRNYTVQFKGLAMSAELAVIARHPSQFHIECEGGGGRLVVAWRRDWANVIKNQNGVSGWVHVIHGGGLTFAEHIRIHACGRTPCRARYRASKYGSLPPPYHVKASITPFAPEVAGANGPEGVNARSSGTIGCAGLPPAAAVDAPSAAVAACAAKGQDPLGRGGETE